MKHTAVYLSNATNKRSVIESILSNTLLREWIDLSGMNGALHSPVVIEQMIDEEVKHDFFPITSRYNTSLMSMSSGEQRQALLHYLIHQAPHYIILDDLLSSIDQDARKSILRYLNQHTGRILFIQLFYRKADVFDFIETIVSVDDKGEIVARQSKDQFLKDLPDSDLPIFHFPDLITGSETVMDPLISMNHVTVSYGDKRVLNGVNWVVRPGEFWQMKGPNGSGKTTLLSMIIGDNPKAFGQEMTLFGYRKGSGETVWDIKKHIGYFYPKMTQLFTREDSVENMIISGFVDSVGLYVKPTDHQRHVAHEWLKVLGSSFQNKRFSELSPGQQRMVLVIRAIIKSPLLLILDEPTVGLDDHHTSLFIGLIRSIASLKKIAIIYVSHRDETSLSPEKIFELIPGKEGSIGRIVENR